MSENALEKIGDQLFGVITHDVIAKAKKIIQEQNNEMDAILFSELLIQTCDMLHYIKNKNLIPKTVEAELVAEEFKIRWLRMNKIVMKARGKRDSPRWTDEDIRITKEIDQLFRQLYGKSISSNGVVMFLLEAKRNE
jgi:hypothetical protein